MISDPNDADYRETVWQDLLREVAFASDPFRAIHAMGLPDREKLRDRYDGQKEKLIDAEIERRRIRMVQRENVNRAVRGLPLIDPLASSAVQDHHARYPCGLSFEPECHCEGAEVR
jgi:hypothetical protein